MPMPQLRARPVLSPTPSRTRPHIEVAVLVLADPRLPAVVVA